MRLHSGDCQEILKQYKDNTISTIITDPPYNIRLKGLKWDYSLPYIGVFKELLRVIKPGGIMLIFGGTRTFHRLAVNIEDAGWYISNTICWLYAQGMPKSVDIAYMIDKNRDQLGEITQIAKGGDIMGNKSNKKTIQINAPNSEESKIWHGWGTGLAPAWEPILVCHKPIEGNYDDNALKYGVCGFWIDSARIQNEKFQSGIKRTSDGRWPKNVVIDEKISYNLNKEYSQKPARYFYCAKASKLEKGEYNDHDAVKPLKLMRYLVKLTKQPNGGVVLDPYSGTGTTAIACLEEDRDFIMIEKDQHYFNIQNKRISDYESQAKTKKLKFFINQ